MIDLRAGYRATIEQHDVMAGTQPGEIKVRIPSKAPEYPEGFDAILDDVEQTLLNGLTHWQHPSFFGYFPAVASPASVLGDLLSTGLGVVGLSWQASPALTELEEVVCGWVRDLVGLSDAWSGVIQDTASTSTLVALISAREKASDFSLARGGLQAERQPLVVYASGQAHSSVEKAALLADFGRENVRTVPHDASYAMDPEALDALIRQDIEAGMKPCAIVATTGTTTSTAIDPIRSIARIAKAHDLWLHVDAAMAGSAMILHECRWMWDGVEEADSLVINAHKWLGVAFDCSLYYVRDPQHLVRIMSSNPSYLQSSADGRVVNYRDWSIPLGRRFRALKLWTLLRAEGAESLRARLRRDIDNARWLAEVAGSSPDWRVLAPVPLQTVCLRHEPAGLEGEALDRHTLDWVGRINASGKAYLTPATLDGRWMVRVSIGSGTTERAHVESLWESMRQAVEPR